MTCKSVWDVRQRYRGRGLLCNLESPKDSFDTEPRPAAASGRRSASRVRSIAAALLLPAMSMAQLVPDPPKASITLYHGLEVATPGQWSDLSVPMEPSAWHAGRPDGPMATDAQLKSVLGSLGALAIGARCKGVSSGPTFYSWAFELAVPAVTSMSREGALGFRKGWRSTSGDTLTLYDQGSIQAWSIPDKVAAANARYYPPGVEPDFLGLLAPQGFGAGGSLVPGTSLNLRFRVVSNGLAPSCVDVHNGMVIMSTEKLFPALPPPGSGPSI